MEDAMRPAYKLPPDYKCVGNAYLVGTGPGLDAYKWEELQPEDYVLAVNFAGVSCPRYNAFAALDTHRGGVFDDVYPREAVCWTMHPRTLMGRFFNCRVFPHIVKGAGCSSGAFGLCVLYWLGYRKITVIGFDSHITKIHDHAESLIKKGLYSRRDDHPVNRVIQNAVNNTIILLPGLQVVFWNPNGDHLLQPQSVYPYIL